MDILESDPNLGSLLRQGTLLQFANAHITGEISFRSMVICDMHRAGQRMRMIDYAIAQGNHYHAEYMIKNGAPLTLDLNDELARENSGTIEGKWYTTLGYVLHYSRCHTLAMLLTHRGDEIDITRAAVFMGPRERTDACSSYSGIQYALLHAERALLDAMLKFQMVPSRMLAPSTVALYSRGRAMWDFRADKCEQLAHDYYRQAKRREQGARAALWCCSKYGAGGPWTDVWFHLVPHIALTEVEHEGGAKKQRVKE